MLQKDELGLQLVQISTLLTSEEQVLTYAKQAPEHNLTHILPGCLCAAQAEEFVPCYGENLCWCYQRYLLNISHLCSCTDHAQGC